MGSISLKKKKKIRSFNLFSSLHSILRPSLLIPRHLNSDDSQIHISSPNHSPQLQAHIANCLFNISTWLSKWHLDLMSKTELYFSLQTFFSLNVLHFTKQHPQPSSLSGLGVIPDSSLYFIPHMQSISKSCWFYLQNTSFLVNLGIHVFSPYKEFSGASNQWALIFSPSSLF